MYFYKTVNRLATFLSLKPTVDGFVILDRILRETRKLNIKNLYYSKNTKRVYSCTKINKIQNLKNEKKVVNLCLKISLHIITSALKFVAHLCPQSTTLTSNVLEAKSTDTHTNHMPWNVNIPRTLRHKQNK